MISQKFLNKLNKDKYYCYFCAEEGIIKEIQFDENNLIIPCEIHKNKKSNFYSIYFNKETNRWCKKRYNMNKVFDLETIEELQEKELNSRYRYININDLPEDIEIKDNKENGVFYLSNLLNNDYISVHENNFTYKKVDLIRECNSCCCNNIFRINDIARIKESICCSTICYQNLENELREESIKNGNKYLSEEFLNKLYETKFYCYYCARLNIINELKYDKNNNQYIPCKDHRGSNYLILGYKNDINKWCIIHGVK